MKYQTVETIALLEVLTKLAPESSKTTLRSWIKEGRVTVDGILAKNGSELVSPNQTVIVGAKKKRVEDIELLYEDAHLVVVEKPTKILSVATDSEAEQTVHNFLKMRYKKVYVVHRLDRDTSGLLLFALSDDAYHKLYTLFEKHEIKRCYTGIVEGRFDAASGKWESYLYEDEQFNVHSTANPQKGVKAITHFEVKKSGKNYSLVQFTLETGKKNQIRVHCSVAGRPIAGDRKYGAQTDPLKRMCLHAHSLSFLHPITNKPMHFTSPLPKEFARL